MQPLLSFAGRQTLERVGFRQELGRCLDLVTIVGQELKVRDDLSQPKPPSNCEHGGQTGAGQH
jgi:hypothetical protein